MERTVAARSDVVNYAYNMKDRESEAAEGSWRLERAAVERVARASREPRHDARGGAALRSGCDELDDGRHRRVVVDRGARGRADHECHLALRHHLEPLGETARGVADDLFVQLRQLPADGTGRSDRPRRGSRASRVGASAIRTRRLDAAIRAAPATARLAPSRCAGRSRRTGTARRRGRWQRAPSRRPTGPAARSPARRQPWRQR